MNDFQVVPVALIIAGITFVFTFHMLFTFILRSLYSVIFSAYVFITFMSPEMATSISIHVFFLTDYNIHFIVWNVSVGLHLLIPLFLHRYLILIS
jgi:hypothetical protein